MALTRLVAEVVLRPPDLRHFDAAVGSLGAQPRGESGLRQALNASFASRCPTCGRPIVVDEFVWDGDAPAPVPQDLPLHGLPRPAGRRRAALGAHRRRRHRPRLGAGRLGRGDPGAGGAAGALPRAGGRERPGGPHPGPLHGALAGGAAGHPRTHRAGPPRRPDRGRPAPGPGSRAAAGQPPAQLPRPRRRAAHRQRHRPPAGRPAVARAQPVAAVRGRLPPRARVHPAPGGLARRTAPGAPG